MLFSIFFIHSVTFSLHLSIFMHYKFSNFNTKNIVLTGLMSVKKVTFDTSQEKHAILT
jgi:hypothetical protein